MTPLGQSMERHLGVSPNYLIWPSCFGSTPFGRETRGLAAQQFTASGRNRAASSGRTTTVVPFEHTVMVIGYRPDTVTILDGGTAHIRLLTRFIDSWETLGNTVVPWGSA